MPAAAGCGAAGLGVSWGGGAAADAGGGAGVAAGVEEKSCGAGMPMARSGTCERKLDDAGSVFEGALDAAGIAVVPHEDMAPEASMHIWWGWCVVTAGMHVGSDAVHCLLSGGAEGDVRVKDVVEVGAPVCRVIGVCSSPDEGPEFVASASRPA